MLLTWCRVIALTFEELREQADLLARGTYRAEEQKLPPELLQLTYLQHVAIAFRREKALWNGEGLPFQIEFFHPGYIHRDVVQVYETDGDITRPIVYSSDLFTYGTNRAVLSTNGGFAGFRINHPKSHFGEVAVFLGASYFRMIGRGQDYGTSARGLAVDVTGTEEFPVFKRFWLRRPSADSGDFSMLALLDSPSVAGAFEFLVRPGVATTAEVRAALFARREIRDLGLAPLTSMFLHDDNGRLLNTDFRPEVHDADGLLLHTGAGGWIWRPLEKGRMLRVNAYNDQNPQGFGLLQRDREFERYQDLVAHFERRPTVWIEPLGNWGRGSVTLVQLPSDREFSDNIVAYWNPEEPLRPGKSLEYRYRLSWSTNRCLPEPLAAVRSSRIGIVVEEPPKIPPNVRFVVDFEALPESPTSGAASPRPDISCGEGAVLVGQSFLHNSINNTWRLVIETTQPTKAVDLSAALSANGHLVSEVWKYTWQP